MLRTIGYTILGALLGPVIWILLFHPSENATNWLYYSLLIGGVIGLVIATYLNYHYRNYVQPPVPPVDLSPKGLLTGYGGWRILTLLSIVICLFLAYIISSVSNIDFSKVSLVLLAISIVPVWIILGRLNSK